MDIMLNNVRVTCATKRLVFLILNFLYSAHCFFILSTLVEESKWKKKCDLRQNQIISFVCLPFTLFHFRLLFQQYGAACLWTVLQQTIPQNISHLFSIFSNYNDTDVLLRFKLSCEQFSTCSNTTSSYNSYDTFINKWKGIILPCLFS